MRREFNYCLPVTFGIEWKIAMAEGNLICDEEVHPEPEKFPYFKRYPVFNIEQ